MLNTAIRPVPNRSSANDEDAIVRLPTCSVDDRWVELATQPLVNSSQTFTVACTAANTAMATATFFGNVSTLGVTQAVNSAQNLRAVAGWGSNFVLGPLPNLTAMAALVAGSYSFSTALTAHTSPTGGRLVTFEAPAPMTEAENCASEWLPKFSSENGWTAPHITRSEMGEVVYEWWRGEKKLTIYFGDNSAEYIKVWGTDIETEMESDQLDDNSKLPALRLWLYS